MIALAADPIDPGAALSRLAESCPGAGAIVSFVGLVRGEAGAVTGLELDHHPRITLKAIEAIAAEARARFDLIDLAVLHRHGRLKPGEPIVFVAAAAAHRRMAFDAAEYLIDRLKTEAPFWKREEGPAGARWIEPRPSDHDDRARWDAKEDENARH
jgi:molybdopterin synthase catalytic subunit